MGPDDPGEISDRGCYEHGKPKAQTADQSIVECRRSFEYIVGKIVGKKDAV
jgi:hypothetical protein